MDQKNNVDLTKKELSEMFLSFVSKKYNISEDELLEFINSKRKETKIPDRDVIPISIFHDKALGPKQAIVKFLKENKGLRYSEIAGIVKRDERSVWHTYRSATKKRTTPILPVYSKYDAPYSIFSNKKLSALENISIFLKEKFSLTYAKIADILQRDERTIWTVCRRARSKNE
jgi:hypothetical protein